MRPRYRSLILMVFCDTQIYDILLMKLAETKKKELNHSFYIMLEYTLMKNGNKQL